MSEPKAPLEGCCRQLGLHHRTFAVSMLAFGSTMIHTIFMFYYVKVFVNIYHITDAWFNLAQVLFMIWNAVNDPLFSCLQDLRTDAWYHNRRLVIYHGAPWFALSFLLPWFQPWLWDVETVPPWLTGVHLIVSLFFYDALFSWVLLAHCALFTEQSTAASDRVRITKYIICFTLAALPSLFIVDKVSSSLTNFHAFQAATVVISIVACGAFRYTGKYSSGTIAHCVVDIPRGINTNNAGSCSVDDVADKEQLKEVITVDPDERIEEWSNVRVRSMEVLKDSNFHCIVWTNFLQILRVYCHTNFAAMFVEALLSDHLPIGSWRISMFYGLTALLPNIFYVLVISKVALRIGAWRTFLYGSITSMFFALVSYLVIDSPGYLFMLYLQIDCILTYSASPLMNILFPEIVDEDMRIHKRKKPITTMIYGINALFTKPAQSLAAMITMYALNRAGYAAYKANGLGPTHSATAAATYITHDTGFVELKTFMFRWCFAAPAFLCFLQLLSLWRYGLRDRFRTAPVTDTVVPLSL